MSTATPLPERELRNADLQTLVGVLRAQHAQKIDVVAPASQLRMDEGRLVLTGLEPQMSDDGVTDVNGGYSTTRVADGHLAEKLGIPTDYLRRMRASNVELLDANVNGWLHHDNERRKFLVRALWGHDPDQLNSQGVVRAMLSDSYGFRDNLDTLMAMLQGLKEAGLDATSIRGADLTDNRLYVRVEAPEISVMAPELLRNYRSPFTGQSGKDCPIVYAGIVLRNSETGGGALSVTPELRVKVCDNGLVIKADQVRQIHVGKQLTEGNVSWSQETYNAEDKVTTLKVKDAVMSFLSAEYVSATVEKLEETATTTLDKPMDVVKTVAKTLRFTEAESEGLLDHFIKGGDTTAGGVMHAVTSYAQVIEDVDRANDFAGFGVAAMELAAASK